MHFLSQGSHMTLMPLRIWTMVHHILRGRPLHPRRDLRVEEGEREDNIIFPWWTVHLFKIQIAPCPMPMDLTHTWPPILHNWPKMCNGSMSMRIWSSITCWCNNGKQLLHGQEKHGKSIKPNCWLHRG
jgi:hypothetical protein